jgi:hypothetical protein
MEDDGIFYGRLVYFMVIWYILRPFGIGTFFPFLVCCTKKNLARREFVNKCCLHFCVHNLAADNVTVGN